MSAHRSGETTTGRAIATGIVLATLAGVAVVVYVDLRLPDLSNQNRVEGFAFLAGFVACAVAGAVILLRRPRHAIGWLLAAIGVIPLIAVPLERWGTYVMLTEGRPDAATVLGFWLNSWYWYLLIALVLVYLPLLYPTGRLPSPRWRAMASIPTAALSGMVLLGMVNPTIGSQEQRSITIPNPIGIDGVAPVEESMIGSVLFLGVLIGIGLGIVAVVVRFRRSSGLERQQMKWFFAPALLQPLGFLELLGVPESALVLVMPLTIAAFPVAIGIAITRYHLYDLGRLVSRTVTYAVVLALLVGLYAGAVLLLGTAAREVAGEQSDLVVALSTLLAAAAFQPVRGRVRTVVDRRFNRSRYDAARTVEAFGAELREELDLSSLSATLHTAAARSLNPAHVSVWIQTPGP